MTLRSPAVPALLWFLSFLCALYPVNGWQLGLYAGAVLSLFAWAYMMLAAKLAEGWKVPRSPVAVLAACFWLLAFASIFWSGVKPLSLVAFTTFSALPLTFLIGIATAERSFFRMLAWPLCALFAVLATWAVIQFFFLNAYFWGQARHPLADPSSLGALLSLGLFCAIAVILAAGKTSERRAATALAMLLVAGMMATVARGPLLALVPGLATLAMLAWPDVKARWRCFALIALAGLAFQGLAQLGAQKQYDLGKRLFDAPTPISGTTNRIELWRSALEMIKDRPLLGTGIGTFSQYYPEYRSPDETDGAYLAHNDPLQFWIELGLLGPVAFYGFCLAAALRMARARRHPADGDQKQRRVVAAALFAGFVSLVAGAHVGFSLYNLSILLLAGLMLAAWFRLTAPDGEQVHRVCATAERIPGLNRLLLAAPFVMLGWLVCSLVAGEFYASRAAKALFSEQIFDFQEAINRAGRASFDLNARAYLLAVNVPTATLEFKGPKAPAEEQRLLYGQAAGYMARVLEINPRAAEAHYYLGKIQTLVDPAIVPPGTPSPEECYRRALALNPALVGARMELHRLVAQQGGSPQAQIAILEPGSKFIYNTQAVMGYYGALAKLYAETGDYEKEKALLWMQTDFMKRSVFSAMRQETSIPRAIEGGDAMFPQYR